jgi:hypothetical protein
MRVPHDKAENMALALAFPAAMRSAALAALSTFPESPNRSGTFSLWVEGEIVSIPGRIYHDPSQIDIPNLSLIQREITNALLTRHADGFVRQHSLSKILSLKYMWIPPFVVQLVGEYVVEIVADIESAISSLDPHQYGSFVRANPIFFTKTRQRAASYWDCYYRRRYDWASYPAKRVLDFLESTLESNGPKTELHNS